MAKQQCDPKNLTDPRHRFTQRPNGKNSREQIRVCGQCGTTKPVSR